MAFGLALGLAGSIGVSRLLSTFLFGASPDRLRIYLLVATVVLAVALFANWVPARRAARTELAEVLRAE